MSHRGEQSVERRQSPVGLRALSILAALVGAAPLCGFVTLPPTAVQQALAAHHTNNDPAWTTLRDARVDEDKARGLLTASFGPTVRRLDGQPFRISGYITPLEADLHTRHFIVTRRDTTCPFCPPNTPTEAVEVMLAQPVQLTRAEVSLTGRLELVSSSDAGLFYRLSGAALTTPSTPRS